MKATFVVTLATILVAYGTAIKPVCPPVNGEDVTLLPNPNDCKTYYSCNEGIPHLMQCYTGLEFNPVERVCDWPEHAGCIPAGPENPGKPGFQSRPDEPETPKESLPNNGLGHPEDSPHPDQPPRPPKPACPAETPDPEKPPHPSKPPRPTELPRPSEEPRPTELPRPTATTNRRPIWPPRPILPPIPIWPPRPMLSAGPLDNTAVNDVDGVA